MDQFIAKATEVLFGYGLPGLVIAYLIYERTILQGQIKDLLAALNNSQEKRIEEARETTTGLDTIKDTIQILTSFMQGRGNGGNRNV